MNTIVLSPQTRCADAAVATIGCFDGVHKGHQRVIRLVTELARSRGLKPVVITFDRQPRQLFDPSFRPQLLSTLKEKESYIESLGVEQVGGIALYERAGGSFCRSFYAQGATRPTFGEGTVDGL